jgi:phospholipid transport system transporter-binding protein
MNSDMTDATVTRNEDTLAFAGALDRAAVATLWLQAQTLLAGVRRLDLSAVTRVDSAGLALLAELAARIDGVTVTGRPDGLDELRAAYRLQDDLSFAA